MGAGSFGQDADIFGVFGTSAGSSGLGSTIPCGVLGDSGSGVGVIGRSGSNAGIIGSSDSNDGLAGLSNTGNGVEGISTTGAAIRGRALIGSGLAGVFDGPVTVNGDLTVQGTVNANNANSAVKQFRIDHPLDPANKYLVHTSIESPDMKNIYDGVAVLDSAGEALVELPQWFEVLNQQFRYQLTPLGAPGPNLHIKERIHGTRFKIAGGEPGMEVSWQVTGIRHDLYANAHRSPVEEEKTEGERGYYLHPELYGQPPERGIEWGRRPEFMRRTRDMEQRDRSRIAATLHDVLGVEPAPARSASTRGPLR